jgi:hypothetical protein
MPSKVDVMSPLQRDGAIATRRWVYSRFASDAADGSGVGSLHSRPKRRACGSAIEWPSVHACASRFRFFGIIVVHALARAHQICESIRDAGCAQIKCTRLQQRSPLSCLSQGNCVRISEQGIEFGFARTSRCTRGRILLSLPKADDQFARATSSKGYAPSRDCDARYGTRREA